MRVLKVSMWTGLVTASRYVGFDWFKVQVGSIFVYSMLLLLVVSHAQGLPPAITSGAFAKMASYLWMMLGGRSWSHSRQQSWNQTESQKKVWKRDEQQDKDAERWFTFEYGMDMYGSHQSHLHAFDIKLLQFAIFGHPRHLRLRGRRGQVLSIFLRAQDSHGPSTHRGRLYRARWTTSTSSCQAVSTCYGSPW